MITRLRDKYGFKTALCCPYNTRLDPEPRYYRRGFFDRFDVGTRLEDYPDNEYEIVWNFCYLHRKPEMVRQMRRVSNRFVLGLVSNGCNPGLIAHGIYHGIRHDWAECVHPERGDKKLMTQSGLRSIFEESDLKVLETGAFDCAPWPDTVCSIREFFGMSGFHDETSLRLPWSPRILAVETLTLPLGRIFGHHIYCLGEKT